MKKALFVIPAVAAALMMAAQPADASGKRHGFHFGWHTPHWGYDDPYYRPVHDYHRIPAWKIWSILGGYGYHGFHKVNYWGGYYRCFAWRHGRLYRIKVSARTGRMVSRRRMR